jgi:hypothetical protein
MTQITPKPLYLKDVTLKIGDDNYEKTISGCTFTPTSTAATWTGLTPTASFSEQSTPTWVCGLDYVQDWESADSLARYLHDHAGQQVDAAFEPRAGGPAVTAKLTLVPGPIGGPGGAFATASVSLGSSYPELEDAAPAAGE